MLLRLQLHRFYPLGSILHNILIDFIIFVQFLSKLINGNIKMFHIDTLIPALQFSIYYISL